MLGSGQTRPQLTALVKPQQLNQSCADQSANDVQYQSFEPSEPRRRLLPAAFFCHFPLHLAAKRHGFKAPTPCCRMAADMTARPA